MIYIFYSHHNELIFRIEKAPIAKQERIQPIEDDQHKQIKPLEQKQKSDTNVQPKVRFVFND